MNKESIFKCEICGRVLRDRSECAELRGAVVCLSCFDKDRLSENLAYLRAKYGERWVKLVAGSEDCAKTKCRVRSRALHLLRKILSLLKRARDVKIVRVDERRMRKIKELSKKICSLTLSSIEIISTNKLRRDAVEHLAQAEKHLGWLVNKARASVWYRD